MLFSHTSMANSGLASEKHTTTSSSLSVLARLGQRGSESDKQNDDNVADDHRTGLQQGLSRSDWPQESPSRPPLALNAQCIDSRLFFPSTTQTSQAACFWRAVRHAMSLFSADDTRCEAVHPKTNPPSQQRLK